MNVFIANKDEDRWSPTTEGSKRHHDSLVLSLSRETISSSSKARTTQSRGLKRHRNVSHCTDPFAPGNRHVRQKSPSG